MPRRASSPLQPSSIVASLTLKWALRLQDLPRSSGAAQEPTTERKGSKRMSVAHFKARNAAHWSIR